MKRFIEITVFPILTMVSFYIFSGVNHFTGVMHPNSLLLESEDTTELIRLVETDTFRLRIIPPSSGVQFFKEGIVFLSLTKNERKMSPDQISFGAVEAYYAPVIDTVPGSHKIFAPLSSFSYPCEAMTFSRDYNTIYFTKIPKNDKKEKIFMAKFTPDSKSRVNLTEETTPLDFCKDNFNYTHPALSSDENTLIFASDDKEGSYGGMDLFISRRSGEKWSVCENLGKIINTAGNEFFPFLDQENNLYFSSDRLPGSGGYDVFTCKYNGTGWDKPVNMSGRINSDKDDIAFTINKMDGKTAFFTRRQPGNGSMQLLKVSLKQEVAEQRLLSLSYIFNGKPGPDTSLIAAAKRKESHIADSIKNIAELSKVTKPKPVSKTPVSKKPAAKPSVTKPTDAKVVIIKPTVSTPAELKDVVIYRVQFLASPKPKVTKEIILDGKNYKLYEFFYLGAYRYAVGEFKTLQPAIDLQKLCRQSGYPQAFVAAFKNNTRSVDLKTFK